MLSRMTLARRVCRSVAHCLIALGCALVATPPAVGQTAPPPTLPAVKGSIGAAVQVGTTLYLAGSFDRVGHRAHGLALVGTDGALVPGAMPSFDGDVTEVLADGAGGLLALGEFSTVDGRPQAQFVRIAPDGRVDPRFRIEADGPIQAIALAHGRIYLAGGFRTVNGLPRPGLAALDASSGALSAWA